MIIKNYLKNFYKDIYLSSDEKNDVNKYFLCNIIEKCNDLLRK